MATRAGGLSPAGRITAPIYAALRQIQRVFGEGTLAGLSDIELLEKLLDSMRVRDPKRPTPARGAGEIAIEEPDTAPGFRRKCRFFDGGAGALVGR